ncbi:MAG: hypothetical protein LBB13_04195, partial [Rickettsiales bacterium]|nr:hypothetical protein [Rickettsiales bacterium]
GETVDKFGDNYGSLDEIVFNPLGAVMVKKGQEIINDTIAKNDEALKSEKDGTAQDESATLKSKDVGLTIEVVISPTTSNEDGEL